MGLIFLPSWSSMFSSAMIVSWGGGGWIVV